MGQREWYGSNPVMTHFLWFALAATVLFIVCVLVILIRQIRKRLELDRLRRATSTGTSRDLSWNVTRFSIAGLMFYIIATGTRRVDGKDFSLFYVPLSDKCTKS